MEAARKSRHLARRLGREHPEALLVVAGCDVELEAKAFAEMARRPLLLGNQEKDAVVARVLAALGESGPEPAMEPVEALRRVRGKTRAFVKVQDGCRHACTYCVVWRARGPERSRPVAEVIAEVRRLVARGIEEIVLTGVQVGAWRGGEGQALPGLVAAILAETEVRRLRLSSVEPWSLSAQWWPLWAEGRLCPHLHVPIQSGSDAVLARMGREVPAAAIMGLVEEARAAIAGLTVGTDVIAGFPGESAVQWQETLAVLEALRPAQVHVFPFSARPGAVAAKMAGQVALEVRRARAAEAQDVAQRLRGEVLLAQVGEVRQVLWERVSRRDGIERWGGYTENYLWLEVEVAAGWVRRNQVSPVRVVAVQGDALVGRLVGGAEDHGVEVR